MSIQKDLFQLVDEKKYDDAIRLLNQELDKSAQKVDLLLLRSKVSTRMNKFNEGLNDAEKASSLCKGSAEAYLRRAINLWRLSRKDEARSLTQYFPKSQEAETWKKIINDSTFSSQQEASMSSSTKNSSAQKPAAQSQIPRVDWYQTPTTVTLMLYKKGLDPRTPSEINTTSLSIDTPDFKWKQESNTIIPEQSSSTITAYKIEFSLKKSSSGNWKSLTEMEQNIATSESHNVPERGATRASKSGAGLQYDKWNSLDDSDTESSDPMDFFQKLYSTADDATKRAMLKSYTESNGTALSTDWSEVSRGKVPVSPPKDMEAKKW